MKEVPENWTDIQATVPVYLPGDDGTRVMAGRMTIPRDGKIEIEMATKDGTDRLVRMITEAELMGISFDLRGYPMELVETPTIVPYLDCD